MCGSRCCALKLMCRTRSVPSSVYAPAGRVFGLMEIPRFNWHLMTSLFTRDNTERRKKKKSRTDEKKKMLRVVRVCVVRDSLCISLESDTHTHTHKVTEEKQEMGKQKKTKNF